MGKYWTNKIPGQDIISAQDFNVAFAAVEDDIDSFGNIQHIEDDTPQGSVKTADAGNTVVSEGGVALGYGNTAGLLAYYYKAIDLEAKKIYLAPYTSIAERNAAGVPFITTEDLTDATFEAPAYAIGDQVNIINSSHHAHCGTITAIDHNAITIAEDLPFDEIKTPAGYTEDVEEWTLCVPAKASVGLIDIGGVCTAFGDSNTSASYGGLVSGIRNKNIDNYGAAFGRDNTVGYASLSSGGWNSIEGEYATAHGAYLEAPANCQLVCGRANIPMSDKIFIVGNGADKNHRSNALTLDWDGNLYIKGGLNCDKLSEAVIGQTNAGGYIKEVSRTYYDFSDAAAILDDAENSTVLFNTNSSTDHKWMDATSGFTNLLAIIHNNNKAQYIHSYYEVIGGQVVNPASPPYSITFKGGSTKNFNGVKVYFRTDTVTPQGEEPYKRLSLNSTPTDITISYTGTVNGVKHSYSHTFTNIPSDCQQDEDGYFYMDLPLVYATLPEASDGEFTVLVTATNGKYCCLSKVLPYKAIYGLDRFIDGNVELGDLPTIINVMESEKANVTDLNTLSATVASKADKTELLKNIKDGIDTGTGNVIDGAIQSKNSAANAKDAVSLGGGTEAAAEYSFAIGRNSKVQQARSKYAIAQGINSFAANEGAKAFGQNVVVGTAWQTSFGKFNNNGYSGAFSVGIGTDGQNRANGFEVDWNGNIRAAGTITDGVGNVLGANVSPFYVADVTLTMESTVGSNLTEYTQLVFYSSITIPQNAPVDFSVAPIVVPHEDVYIIGSKYTPSTRNLYIETSTENDREKTFTLYFKRAGASADAAWDFTQ